ncbi:MAG: HAD-IA family hydrolase [Alphaproteobacteria bacterium]|nr:HAD-IA family hydrolase [Alphaproteobacteria bacterium]
MPASPAAVIFDLDGTLIDSAPDLLEALNHVLAQQGRRRADLHEVHMMMGHGAVHLLDKGLAATGGVPPEGVHEALVESFLEYYEAHIAVHSRPFPGVVETLTSLRDAGHRMAVCTNKMQHFADKVLDALELGDFFETVVGGGATGFYKPDPEHLEAVLGRLGLGVNDAVMVGDSINDVAAAKALDMAAVVVTYGYSPEAVWGLGADKVLERFDALPAALGELATATVGDNP